MNDGIRFHLLVTCDNCYHDPHDGPCRAQDMSTTYHLKKKWRGVLDKHLTEKAFREEINLTPCACGHPS